MPDPTRLLRTFDRAIRAFRATPGRLGRLVRLQGVREVFIVGDLHGNLENFRIALDRARLKEHPQRHLVLQELVHGPFRYPTGGDKSHQLLDLLAALKCQFPRQVHMLLGNHELAQWTGQWIAKDESDLDGLFREGIRSAYSASAQAIYGAYLELFAVVPLALQTPNRVLLSHSLPNAARLETFNKAVLERDTAEDGDLQPGGSIHAMLWGRDTRSATATRFLEIMDADLLLTGHIPCEHGFAAPNERQLILDALGAPACYCLFPTDRSLSQPELLNCVGTLA